MHIEVTAEMLLSQLKYTVNDSSLTQMKIAMNNTKNFDKFSKHLISLNDNLAHVDGYIAMSNNKPYLKIKSENSTNQDLLNKFHSIVKKWSDKYNVSLETIPNKDVYYILGVN